MINVKTWQLISYSFPDNILSGSKNDVKCEKISELKNEWITIKHYKCL